MGPMGRMTLDPFGSRSSTASTPMMGSDVPNARVCALGQSAPVMGIAHPLLSEALKASRVRRFSGHPEDFEEFEREWNFHLKLMHGSCPGALPDAVVLMNLKNFLDEASAALLQGKMALDPDLSYYAFFEELKAKYLRDARSVHRQNWRTVRLTVAGSRVTPQDWAKFQAIYCSKRGLVEDWSDAEDQQNVFSQVPQGLQMKVLAETRKRRNGKLWVRVVIPPGLAMPDVVENISDELGIRLQVISQDKRHFVINCRNQVEMQSLLDLEGCKLDGGVIRVQRAEYSMSGDDIFAFVKQLLETEEELESLRRSYDMHVQSPRSSVHAVQIESKDDSGQRYNRSPNNTPRGSSWSNKGNETRKGTAQKGKGKSHDKTNNNGDKKSSGNGGRGPSSSFSGCRTCHREKRDADHDWKTCEHNQRSRAEWREKQAAQQSGSRDSRDPPQTQKRSE